MCSLSAAGGVTCWGANYVGQTTVPESAAIFGQVTVSAGGSHTCSVSAAGNIICWGSTFLSLTPFVARIGQVAVSTGASHTCALSAAGSVLCWGSNSYGQSLVPATLPLLSVPLPCRPPGLVIPTLSPSAAPTPAFACGAELFRLLPRMDLVGNPTAVNAAIEMQPPTWLRSEESCRIACCAAAGCTGYSFALHDAALRIGAPVACFLLSNVTQLVPSQIMASGVLRSSLL